MTVDDVLKLIAEAKANAYRSARLAVDPDGRRSSALDVSPAVNAARLAVIEGLLCAFAAQGREGDEPGEVKTALELREYWELVAKTIENAAPYPHHAGCALDSAHLGVCIDAAGNLLYRPIPEVPVRGGES